MEFGKGIYRFFLRDRQHDMRFLTDVKVRVLLLQDKKYSNSCLFEWISATLSPDQTVRHLETRLVVIWADPCEL